MGVRVTDIRIPRGISIKKKKKIGPVAKAR